MKTIKIKYSGMGGNFDEKNNFISNILREHFNIELSDDPDFLIYSVNSKEYLNYNCVRIFYTAENLVPDFNVCDYGIGFHYLDFEDRYIRYPLYLVDGFTAYKNDDYSNDLIRARNKHIHISKHMANKNSFCSFVYSNADASDCRENIFIKLNSYKEVNSGGRYKNNVGGPIQSKLGFQEKHKFVIAFENTMGNGYTTEKIIHAFSAGAIPIYWGNPEITKECNSDAFINCHDFGLEADTPVDSPIYDEIINRIIEIDENEQRYLEMLKQPAFSKDYNIDEQQQKFQKYLINIFSQDKETAYRRNLKYWGERYERKQKIGNNYYWMLHKLVPIRDFLFNRNKV
ncbi:glycosyltransferase family 10 domain-containing protein [Tannockella kyphosi]|uniref:glycosyltransferase family 10 domain-containing protein n=1 Tax=Tannockella kyphosi TaxID=2899121 RepID=UPI002012146C|nr:glycosyltransferase family 10 [Tannockella kyphosi]